MSKSRKYIPLIGNLFVILLGIELIFGVSAVFVESKTQEKEPFFNVLENLGEEILIIEENSLLPISSPVNSGPRVKKLKVVITAYSSTPWETDDSPYITASGAEVEDGIVANNLLPFGTKVRIPELYGNKVFVVKDRMSWKKGKYHVDIWHPSYEEALSFGAKITYIEILES